MIIRINLHPAKKPKVKTNPGVYVVLAGVVVMVLIIAVFLFQAGEINSETKRVKSRNAEVQNQITEVQGRIQDVGVMQGKIKELNERQIILARLASIRQGPQYVLNEFGRILSNPKDVLARKEAVELEWTLAWDPDSIFLKTFKESEGGLIEVTGTARNMDDIYEFWTRMKTSPILRNIKFVESKDSREASADTAQAFQFTANANFNYQTKEGLALVDSLTQTNNDVASEEGKAPAETGVK